MDALRNSKKISLLAVAILFLFTFFTLILDAPRTLQFTPLFSSMATKFEPSVQCPHTTVVSNGGTPLSNTK